MTVQSDPIPDSTFPAWSHSVSECLAKFQVEQSQGLSQEEVAWRRSRFGYNELEKEPGTPFWRLVLDQFNDTLVKILLAAAAVSFVLAYVDEQSEGGVTAYVEPLVILLILVLNACVGVWQESNAEKALEALKDLQCETAKVVRSGVRIDDLPARELVPGDLVELRVGDKVPADMRVLGLLTSTLRMEQASLTGESMAVLKSTHAVGAADCELQSKECMVFAGTTVVNGSSLNLVTSTGMRTEIGKIQQQISAAAAEEDDTPLKKKLDEFGKRLTAVIGAICLLVWLINYKHFLTWTPDPAARPFGVRFAFSFQKCTYYFKIAVALAVAAIPEGLPAVITTCLALGTRKMAAKNAIVRKLPSVETLGCTTVICSDKTGTLTTNQMSATALVLPGSSPSSLLSFHVEGTTYNPADGGIANWGQSGSCANVAALADVAVMCNDASVACKAGVYRASGLPTEAALRVLVEKIGVPDELLQQTIAANRRAAPETHLLDANSWWAQHWQRVAVLEFDRSRKSMSVLVRSQATGGTRLLVKGAVESILDRCVAIQLADGSLAPLTHSARQSIDSLLLQMSSQALRCLAFAVKGEGMVEGSGGWGGGVSGGGGLVGGLGGGGFGLGALEGYSGEGHPGHRLLLDPNNYEAIETGLVFVGMVGLRDPPRFEVSGAVASCRAAGIRVMVITGDNKSTAEAICKEIGVMRAGDDARMCSFTGREFMDLPHATRLQILGSPGGKVFSRAEPRHKQEIVRMLRECGEVVAMTGDGVNDAPALKLADIGIAMGIAGTEVAKEASDMVLADDNFSTIVAAVAEGRSIYNNMKAFIRYMISSNMGEVACIFLTAALGMPENLIPVQLLWVNLVTDGPPATALGFNPADENIMLRPPRRSDDALVTPWVLLRYMIIGLYVGVATVGVFAIWYTHSSFLGIDLSADGHSLVTFHQLRNWADCPNWENFTAAPFTAGSSVFSFADNPCDYFVSGKVKATTLSLSVLVAIEMFNSLNALSEDVSLTRMPPWVNPWLLAAMALSFSLHFLILYVPFLANVFGIVPLSVNEWLLVLIISLPVIAIDEVLKKIGREMHRAQQSRQKTKEE